MRKKGLRQGLFAGMNGDPMMPFLADIPVGDFAVDTPDGVHTDPFGLGPYAEGVPKGREETQGATHAKTNIGNAGGRGKTVTLKGD